MSQESGNSVQDMVIGTDSNDFFDQLENSVNGGIMDDAPQEATPEEPEVALTSETEEQDLQEVEESKSIWEDDTNPYKKRYTDSSREALRIREENEERKKYDPLIDVMKNDAGAVEVLREYLKGNVAQQQTVKERLGLDEDFVFDPDEAFADNNSKSAQLMNSHIDNIVSQRVNQAVQGYQNQAMQREQELSAQQEFDNFIKSKGYTPEQAEELQRAASEHQLNWDDIDYLVNRDRAKEKIAQSTKKQMMNQLKKVQNVPKTASKSGSADSKDISHEDAVFNAIKGVDDVLDNLFE